METANIMLDVGSDGSTVIAKTNVTPAEVAVLRVIHGDDAVSEIEVLEKEALNEIGKPRTHRQEIARLTDIYGRVTPEGARRAPAVDMLFPGAAARVFEKFEELELDESLYMAATRATTKPSERSQGPAADENALSSKTVTDLKALADAENVDLEGATRKADIIAKIEAARNADGGGESGSDEGDEGDDEFGEMTDRGGSVLD